MTTVKLPKSYKDSLQKQKVDYSMTPEQMGEKVSIAIENYARDMERELRNMKPRFKR
ncbi:hypothetical protein KX927_03010 [Escherichia coli]|nr:hypothetical protein [Escherichia coli]UWH37697.1 hypothetical protein KX927_03010 [Escherichia coli]